MVLPIARAMRAAALATLVAVWPSVGGAEDSANRIAVRVVEGNGEFYDTATGERFTPRGINYLDFVGRSYAGFEDRPLATDTFDQGKIRSAFAGLAERGYNTVRIFFDHCNDGPECITAVGATGLNPGYLDNLAELTRIAAETGIYLVLTSNDIPDGGGYGDLANRDSGPTMAGYRNTHFLAPSGLEAAGNYWRDLMAGLSERDTAWSAVLGWSLLNEQWIFADQPPWSLSSGTIRNNTGRTYDLADPDEKRRMVSDAVANFAAVLRKIIRAHDPEALVTMGFFAPRFPNPTATGAGWYVDTAPLLAAAPLDFFDFHAYAGGDIGIAEAAENFGMPAHPEKPVIMGELGLFKHTVRSAAFALQLEREWVAASCAAGFDGWLHWGYFRFPGAIDDATWAFLDDDGLLLDELSPARQPDPCSLDGLSPTGNVAYGRPVRVSAALRDAPGNNAVDGTDAGWGSGRHAPGWIEIALAAPTAIDRVVLSVDQYPAGRTRHMVRAVRADGSRVTMATIDRHSDGGDVFDVALPGAIADVTAVRVDTVESPSWVAWREIEVHAARGGATPACVVTAGGRVNLRGDPGTGKPPVGALAPGEAMVADRRTHGAGGADWLRLVGGEWVREDVVLVGPPCADLPLAD